MPAEWKNSRVARRPSAPADPETGFALRLGSDSLLEDTPQMQALEVLGKRRGSGRRVRSGSTASRRRAARHGLSHPPGRRPPHGPGPRPVLDWPVMKIREIMSSDVQCIGPDNTLVEAAGLMRELDVGAIPVCDQEHLAGMLTDRDLVLRAVATGKDPNRATVRETMSEGIFSIFEDQSVEEAAHLMEKKQIRRLPVLSRQKRLVGIVSLGDLAMNSQPAFSGTALREVSRSY